MQRAARNCWPAAHALPGKGYFYAPTVLGDVPDTARIMNEEPFGPVAVLSPFRHFDARRPGGAGIDSTRPLRSTHTSVRDVTEDEVGL